MKEATLFKNKRPFLFSILYKKNRQVFVPIFVLLFFCSLSGFAQMALANEAVSEAWVKRWAGMGGGSASSIALDAGGNVYATGAKPGAVKYNEAGVQQWGIKYNANAFRVGAMTVDAAGNVYLANTSYNDDASDPDENYVVRKLNTLGQQQWLAIYSHIEENDIVKDIAVDEEGNVYVTGISLAYAPEIQYDYATVKYNSSGVQQWVARYNGPGDDFATDLKVDTEGNVYVTGYSSGVGTGVDYATVKYNSAGVQQWVARYNSPDNLHDFARELALDINGNVYVTGSSEIIDTGTDFATIKYNTSGIEQWVSRYNGPDNQDDEASSLRVDTGGNVYVVGKSTRVSGVFCDYPSVWAVIKYAPSGMQQWVTNYEGTNSPYMDLDLGGNVYVTGGKYSDACIHTSYTTVKFNSSGLQQWAIGYDGQESNNDYATAIVVDSVGNVHITGSSQANGTYDLSTIKYTQQAGPALIAVGDAYSTEEGELLTVAAPGVLANDIASDGDSLTGFLVSGPSNGTLAFNSDGSFSYTPESTFNGSDSFTYKAIEGTEESNTAIVTITVNTTGDSVVIHDITAPQNPQEVNSNFSVSAFYSGNSVNTATWDWGDGSTSEGSIGDSLVTGTHSYASPGIYTISIMLTNDQGHTATLEYKYVVVYDPNADFVSGIGWFHSPEGAYLENPSGKGKVDFGFGIQNKKGSGMPHGKMIFKSISGDVRFIGNSFESMVILEKTAVVKGTGSLNHNDNYGFQLTISDDSGQGDPDHIRLQVWDSQGALVYDNQMGNAVDADATTALKKGSIVIHKGSVNTNEWTSKSGQSLKFNAYPVPLSGNGLWLQFPALEKAGTYRVKITNMNGNKFAEKEFKSKISPDPQLWELNVNSWPSGMYILTISGEGAVEKLKLKK